MLKSSRRFRRQAQLFHLFDLIGPPPSALVVYTSTSAYGLSEGGAVQSLRAVLFRGIASSRKDLLKGPLEEAYFERSLWSLENCTTCPGSVVPSLESSSGPKCPFYVKPSSLRDPQR